jgi:hypothetical protein
MMAALSLACAEARSRRCIKIDAGQIVASHSVHPFAYSTKRATSLVHHFVFPVCCVAISGTKGECSVRSVTFHICFVGFPGRVQSD